VSRQSHTKSSSNGRLPKSQPHALGMQVPRVHPEVPAEGVVRGGRKQLGPLFRTLAEHKESAVEEGHLMPDHVHMLLSIPPKYAVSQVVGKSAIQIARRFLEVKRNFVGQHFWARWYFVSTVGRDETVIRAYIRAQEVEDKQAEQLRLQ